MEGFGHGSVLCKFEEGEMSERESIKEVISKEKRDIYYGGKWGSGNLKKKCQRL